MTPGRMPLAACGLTVLWLMLSGEPAAAADWPQWRGPNRDGTSPETGLLRGWPKEGPPLAWKVTDLGTGFSPVSVAGGRVYALAFRGQQEFVVALDRGNGKEVWATPLAPARENTGMMFLTQRAPAVDGDRLYATTTDGTLACLDVDAGKELWRKHYVKDFGGKAGAWSYGDNPLIDGDKLICTPGGKEATLVALDKHTGAVVWKAAVPGGDAASYSAPVVTEAAGVRQYVQFLSRGLVGVAARDGKVLWAYTKLANGTANVGPPYARGDLVFTANGYQTGSALLRLVADQGTFRVEEVYATRKFHNLLGGFVVVSWHVYAGSTPAFAQAAPTCLELKTGAVAWEQKGVASGACSVLAADGHVYFRFADGQVVLVEATPQEYREKGRFTPPDRSGQPSWSSPVLAGGKLFLRDQKYLYCYDLRAGRPAPPPVQKEPVKGGGTREPDAVFIPTPQPVVERMLELAGVKQGDVVYDLGCGDGRIVVTAAGKHGAHAVGVELDPELVQVARAAVKKGKLEGLVAIRQEDLFTADLGEATVVALYLLPELNQKLRPRLDRLRPGTRVVSHAFAIPGARPQKVVRVPGEDGLTEHVLYLYRTPLEKE